MSRIERNLFQSESETYRKLENKGINGNFLNIIKNIYQNTKCAVKQNGKATKFFKYEKGVQQGNPLSPILFNLFIERHFRFF